jgi:predicted nucleotidyltransferase component of viral defense system
VIPREDIVAWSRSIGWPTDDQVEQDLMLSRLIVELAQDPYLGEEHVFRGGTCLHKLYETGAGRYSGDSLSGVDAGQESRRRRGGEARRVMQ